MIYPTVKVEFKEYSDFVCSLEYYNNAGKFSGICKELNVPFKVVKKVHHILLDAQHYPLQEWCG